MWPAAQSPATMTSPPSNSHPSIDWFCHYSSGKSKAQLKSQKAELQMRTHFPKRPCPKKEVRTVRDKPPGDVPQFIASQTRTSAHVLHFLSPNSGPLTHLQHSFVNGSSEEAESTEHVPAVPVIFLGGRLMCAAWLAGTVLTASGAHCNVISTEALMPTLPTAKQSCAMLATIIIVFKGP